MDVNSVWLISYGEATVRLLAATALGGLIGWEREHNNHPAGFRTHILVCIGSALIMLISMYGFAPFMEEEKVRFSPDRMAAQVVSGIGFLGAGTILRQGLTVSGLTTAASLWVVAAIGLAAGAGFFFPAVLTTVLALVSLELLNRLENFLFQRKRLKVIRVQVVDQPGKLGELATRIGRTGAAVRKVQIDEGDPQSRVTDITFTVRMPLHLPLDRMIEAVRETEGVKEVNID
ncbi:MgtC/SapB family protein [Paludifilum halophilum]|uniref:Magnesium transporter MgtC n=1 Tax=Paludifilum halophilum TaxID=1642702 RepID=A0A235B2U8_9BACL|nr:MgtC/SapB family protein [Paludifilum halophilum]OYD06572.1 magnesium transporter MgtC [Paludifilum halophilum]